MQASPIVLTTLAGLSTGLGGALAALAKPSETMLAASAGFAGGVMLTASLADLMPEALEFYSGYLQPLPCGGAIVTLLALGMLAAGLLGRLLPEETELAAKYGQNTARTKAMRTALITGTALLLHNFPEGVLTLFARTADPCAQPWPLPCTISPKVWQWRCPLPMPPTAGPKAHWRHWSPVWPNRRAPWWHCFCSAACSQKDF